MATKTATVCCLLFYVLPTALGSLPAAVGTWTDLGSGCCEPMDSKHFLYNGYVSDCQSVCEAVCESYGDDCGYMNYGWVINGKRSARCTVISKEAEITRRNGPYDCGSCGDCGVRCYSYEAFTSYLTWSGGEFDQLGLGCCEPEDDRDFLFQGPLNQRWSRCQYLCDRLGPRCGYVNFGWLLPGKPFGEDISSWCSVISSGAKVGPLRTGPKDCGSCGDCGVRCQKFSPPGLPGPAPAPTSQMLGQWRDMGKGCCTPDEHCAFLYQGRLNGGESLQKCQAYCESFGSLCGHVNHGWVIGGSTSNWCTVISSEALILSVDSSPGGCGSCGDCGVRCYSFLR